jgi:1,6-anhydro-N-acetylmuramate kinase
MNGDGMMDDDTPLEQLARTLGETVISQIRSSTVYVPQKGSPLGPRRHIDAVKRRMRELPPAEWECACVDKTYYLTPKGLKQELLRYAMVKAAPLAKTAAQPAAPADAGQKLLADLRRLRGS